MNTERYSKLIQYKAALDKAFAKNSGVEIYNTDYENTLRQAKLDGFKVLRNSKGEHKLVDTSNSKSSPLEAFNQLFGGIFN